MSLLPFYNNEYVTLYHGDCVEKLKQIEEGSIDLVVTSPPYNCGIKYNSYDDNLSWSDYVSWCREWVSELYRVCKEDGRIAINVLMESGQNNNKERVNPLTTFVNLVEGIGFKIMGVPVWTDNQRGKLSAWGSWKSASCPYIYNPYEVIIIAYKKKKKKTIRGIDTISKEDFLKGVSGIWNIKPDTNSLTIATFPISLPKLVIELLTYKGDTVLDPFMGSGTTGVACKITERKFIGIELDKKYCGIAKNRIESYSIQNQLNFDFFKENDL